MILFFQDLHSGRFPVLGDRHVGCTPADGGENAVNQLGSDGIENHQAVLSLSTLSLVICLQLRVVLYGRRSAVAQQGLHLPVGQGTDSRPSPDAAARRVFEGGYPGVTGELPPVFEGREVLGIDQEGRSRNQTHAHDRLDQLEVLEDLLVLLHGGLHLLFDVSNLLFDELLLLLGELDDQRVVDQIRGLPQIGQRVLEAGAGLDQPIAEGHQVLQLQEAARGQLNGRQNALTVGRRRAGR